MLRYLLVVLTHGASTTLPRTLDSFREQVTPAPVEALLYIDGPDVGDAAYDAIVGRGIPWTISGEAEQHGFCDAVANAWADAVGSEGDFDHVFWLENDFVFRRPVDLDRLADLLRSDEKLAQVALLRGPANEAELAAGGVVEARPGEFQPRDTASRERWLRHRSYFTTNPSLMTRRFMAENPWPRDGESFCEGRFGLDLIERGYSFGVWGDGSVYVDHVGVRSGSGY